MKVQYCSLVMFALITSAADASATLNVYDIRLGDRGVMQGQLIDGQGQPLARKAVVVSFGGRRVATADRQCDCGAQCTDRRPQQTRRPGDEARAENTGAACRGLVLVRGMNPN